MFPAVHKKKRQAPSVAGCLSIWDCRMRMPTGRRAKRMHTAPAGRNAYRTGVVCGGGKSLVISILRVFRVFRFSMQIYDFFWNIVIFFNISERWRCSFQKVLRELKADINMRVKKKFCQLENILYLCIFN